MYGWIKWFKFRSQRVYLLVSGFFVFFSVYGQEGTVSGIITDSIGYPVPNVNIVVEGTSRGTSSDSTGYFKLIIPADRELTISFSHIRFINRTRLVRVIAGENYQLDISLVKDVRLLDEVEIAGATDLRNQISVITLDPKSALALPTPFDDFNKVLAVPSTWVVAPNRLSVVDPENPFGSL